MYVVPLGGFRPYSVTETKTRHSERLSLGPRSHRHEAFPEVVNKLINLEVKCGSHEGFISKQIVPRFPK